MLESVKLDAVLILTPDLAHHPQTLHSFEAGVHVLVEKPPAYTVAEVEEMAAAAEKAGKHLMVAWNRTYALQRVKALFGDEPPEVLLANYVRPEPAYLGLIRNHIVDPLYFLCGEPAEVTAQCDMFSAQREGHTLANIRFESGAVGSMTSSFGSGGHSEQLTAYGNGYSVFIDSTSRGNGRIMRGGQVDRDARCGGQLGGADPSFHRLYQGRQGAADIGTQVAVRIVRFTRDIMDCGRHGNPAPARRGTGLAYVVHVRRQGNIQRGTMSALRAGVGRLVAAG